MSPQSGLEQRGGPRGNPYMNLQARGGGSKYALVRQNKTLVGDFVANLRTVCHYLIFYLTKILLRLFLNSQ